MKRPLFNDSGELIGIISAKHTDGAENVAVKLSYLNDLVANSGERISLAKSSQIASKKLSEQCKAVIPCTVMVVADNEREGQSRRAATYGSTGQYPIRVNMPEVQQSNSQYTRIIGIELTEKGTAVYISTLNPTDNATSYNINKGTYIVDNATSKKYTLKDTDNIEVAPKKTSLPAGSLADFVLYFPALPASVTSIDLCEPSENGWIFKGIQLM